MNGTDQIMKWLVGVATAAALGLSSWNLSTTSTDHAKISTVEERATAVRDRLDRIEDKIDWLVQERVREYRNDYRPRPGMAIPDNTRPSGPPVKPRSQRP